MKPTPKGWPRISTSLFYEEPAQAIDWICRAFGFEVKLKIEGEGGRIEHSELTYGDGLIMVGAADENPRPRREFAKAPGQVGGCTQVMCIIVDDADAHCAHARQAGAEIVEEPTTHDYGDEYWADRSYLAKDPEGHHWWFMQRVRDQS